MMLGEWHRYMNPQHVAWLVRGGIFAIAAAVLLAATMLVVQILLWLKFDRWLDWATIYGLVFHDGGGPSRSWRGFRNIAEWIVTAPVELGSWVAAVILLLIFTAVRISNRR